MPSIVFLPTPRTRTFLSKTERAGKNNNLFVKRLTGEESAYTATFATTNHCFPASTIFSEIFLQIFPQRFYLRFSASKDFPRHIINQTAFS